MFGIFLFLVSRVVIVMLELLPARGNADILYRYELATAIVSVTNNHHEQDLLASISRWESSHRRSIAECKRLGTEGERGAFQVKARTEDEKRTLCGPLEGQVRIALWHLRHSLIACAALEPHDRLSEYTTGRCIAWQRESRIRWMSEEP